MSEGYYDPHPLLSLEEPLALVGHPGSGVAQAGRAICGRTGLPFNHVERSVEATVGSSRAKVLVSRGGAALRELEAQALKRAVRRRPCGVVVCESGPLEDRRLVDWIAVRCRVVYVRRPEAVLLERIGKQLREAPGSLPEFLAGAPDSAGALGSYLNPRTRMLEFADVVYDAGDEHPSRVADAILGAVDRLIHTERLDR